MVTHDKNEAFFLADKLAVMIGNKIEQCGTTEEIYFGPASKNIANFFSECSYIDGTICRNNCIEHIYQLNDFKDIKKSGIIKILYPVIEKCFYFFKDTFYFEGNVLWDVFAAMYISEPELFYDDVATYELSLEQLKSGKLVKAAYGTKLNLFRLKNADAIYKKIFDQISTFKIRN